ncbi:hypothetical protein K437DRAFT_244165 [Tilletiaria anomala UBC 951]|uniref:S15/NS1 RNA-binding domain-containing protein n=1 Tax=Tilletiaria anomala (strain ATCC 24038 / CBS 436.72 / UBC 951) TaxID=1037660 RepID=A0A066WNJ7_TILAU|nr:uncharacterized protein K437DRAFT_244165 [Tilletiaria anomala UBC 951]KDN52195.1 hypothetical protein K437DRAFT_244165 [Tilletiaria anomala UBC 951]
MASSSLLSRLGAKQVIERSAAGPSGSCLRCQASAFSSTAKVQESKRKRAARIKRRENLEQRQLKKTLLERSKPDPVLGHQLNDEGKALWDMSELKQLLLEKEKVWSGEAGTPTTAPSTSAEDRQLGPSLLNFGLQNSDRKLLFEDLPQIMVEDRLLDSPAAAVTHGSDMLKMEETLLKYEAEEQSSVDVLSRILDLRNASGKGIQVENTRRIVKAFGRPPAKADTGSPEVQAAILTYRIRNLADHLGKARHDNSNRRAMNILVHQRAKVLKYLKRCSPQRYSDVLPRLGLDPRAVEGEITLPGKPKIATR